MRANDDTLRRLYLIEELDVSVATIESGLAELQRSRPYRTRHFVFLLLLATGAERLMKIVLHLHALETTGTFLSRDAMKKWYGHDLSRLCGAVVAECYTPEYLARPFARRDRAFLETDPTFRSMLALLSDFAKADRYVYMDGISDPGVTADWPGRRWDEIEVAMMPDGEYIGLYLSGSEGQAKSHATRARLACLETFVRAQARLFVSGVLGSQARQASPAVSQYFILDDEDLGAKEYDR